MTMTPEQRDEDCARRSCGEPNAAPKWAALSHLQREGLIECTRLACELAEGGKADTPTKLLVSDLARYRTKPDTFTDRMTFSDGSVWVRVDDKVPPAATHEEIAEEVARRTDMPGVARQAALEALRLQSEGWTPTPPVDPVEALHNLIILARPHFSDSTQRLAIAQAESALALLKACKSDCAGREAERAKA